MGTKTSVWQVYVLALISFLVGTSEYIVSGILDQIAESLGVTVVVAGQLITVFSLSFAVGTPILMAATVRLDRRKLMLYALGLFVLANLLSFVLPGFPLFVIARVLMALGAGVVVVVSLSIASKIAPPGKEASSIATVIMGFTAALIVGVPLGRMVASAFDWKAVFLGIALAGLLGLLIIALTVPKVEGDEPVPILQQFALLKQPKIAIGLGITFFWICGYSIVYSYITPYLIEVSGFHPSMVSSALLAFGLASLVGSQLGGYTTDRWGAYATLSRSIGLHMVFLLLLYFTAGSVVAVFVCLILWSFAAWTTGPAQQVNLVKLAPESSGVMLSLNQSAVHLAIAAGAGLGGLVVANVSLAAITWFGAAGLGLSLLGVLLLSRMVSSASPAPRAGQGQRV
ncbi:MFS transporter [Paenibacillus filicis]|uniref:MFS transporter n=1 Tax=Paenibacillus filicis TaxID=669464 RepID=A0ABU9DRR3_9BACL